MNASQTKTMIVSMSRIMHSRSLPFTIGGTVQSVLKKYDDLDILRVAYDSKMSFENHICSVFREASQSIGIVS